MYSARQPLETYDVNSILGPELHAHELGKSLKDENKNAAQINGTHQIICVQKLANRCPSEYIAAASRRVSDISNLAYDQK